MEEYDLKCISVLKECKNTMKSLKHSEIDRVLNVINTSIRNIERGGNTYITNTKVKSNKVKAVGKNIDLLELLKNNHECTVYLGKECANTHDDLVEIHHREYGGTLTRVIDLPLGAEFYVANGHWTGTIIGTEENKQVLVHETGGIWALDTSRYLWLAEARRGEI